MIPASAGQPNERSAIDVLQGWIDRLSLISAYLAAGCLVLLTLLTLTQVALGALSKVSHFFPSDISFGWEYSAYLMGTAFMLGGALTLRAGMQIRVEVVLRLFGGRFRDPLEIGSSIIGAAFVSFLAFSLTRFAWDSFQSGQVSGSTFTPLWIPQCALAIGAIIFALQSVMRAIAAVLGRSLVNESFKVTSVSE
jgi:TRAP-type mannitol/chloroaromatic compound transport system permease small subunit